MLMTINRQGAKTTQRTQKGIDKDKNRSIMKAALFLALFAKKDFASLR